MTRYLSAGVMAPGPPVTCRSRDLGVAFGVTAPRPPVTCRGRDRGVAFGAAAAGRARVPIPAQSTPSFLSLSITLPLGV